jgi:hypothetical protein
MRHGLSRGYTAAEKTELWDRWQRGETLKAIGRAFGKGSSSIYFQIAPHGGIRPAPRRRSRLALTLVEREEISRGIAAAETARSMARKLGRSASTVSREISRNGGYDRYRASQAEETAWVRARRPKRCKRAANPHLRETVARKLRGNWSPEQIAGWLKSAHPGDEANRVSHETIYRSLFVQARGVLKKELLGHLRSKRTIRRSMGGRARPWRSKRRQIDLTPVLRRSVEPAAKSGQGSAHELSAHPAHAPQLPHSILNSGSNRSFTTSSFKPMPMPGASGTGRKPSASSFTGSHNSVKDFS